MEFCKDVRDGKMISFAIICVGVCIGSEAVSELNVWKDMAMYLFVVIKFDPFSRI